MDSISMLSGRGELDFRILRVFESRKWYGSNGKDLADSKMQYELNGRDSISHLSLP